MLREELEWLNYFPAGFKLNVPLTLTLGSGTLFGMEAYASVVGQLAPFEVSPLPPRADPEPTPRIVALKLG